MQWARVGCYLFSPYETTEFSQYIISTCAYITIPVPWSSILISVHLLKKKMSIHLPKVSLSPVLPFHQHEPEESTGKSRVSLVGACCESDQEAFFFISFYSSVLGMQFLILCSRHIKILSCLSSCAWGPSWFQGMNTLWEPERRVLSRHRAGDTEVWKPAPPTYASSAGGHMGQRKRQTSTLLYRWHMHLPDTSRTARVGKDGLLTPIPALQLWMLLHFIL